MHSRRHPIRNAILVIVGFVALAGEVGAADLVAPSVQKTLEASFSAKGQATLARLAQDKTQGLCTHYATSPIPAKVVTEITAMGFATIKYPADGEYLGDWQRGEQIAQSGLGKQSSDDVEKPAGGNCYACHELTKAEIAHGNLGPSLYHYGKLHGDNDVVKKYTWGKIYNAEAFTACSSMPRFGHKGILTAAQMKDLMSLLFDPRSPVNQ